jgi:hypothetical protein
VIELQVIDAEKQTQILSLLNRKTPHEVATLLKKQTQIPRAVIDAEILFTFQ